MVLIFCRGMFSHWIGCTIENCQKNLLQNKRWLDSWCSLYYSRDFDSANFYDSTTDYGMVTLQVREDGNMSCLLILCGDYCKYWNSYFRLSLRLSRYDFHINIYPISLRMWRQYLVYSFPVSWSFDYIPFYF
jgi:hypothetical protein